MSSSTNDSDRVPRSDSLAAILIDYDNCFHALQGHLSGDLRPHDVIAEVLRELRHYLRELNQTRPSVVTAYADFDHLSSESRSIQKSLYLLGAEPRFVPTSLQSNATELQLTVDAVDLLHTRPDIETLAILTGDRAYVPLVQHAKRYGCHTFVTTFNTPPPDGSLPNAEDDFFLAAANLLPDELRDAIQQRHRANGQALSDGQYGGMPKDPTFFDIEDDEAYETLEIIEEHFGQYEEVYLTPLLRKLSELLHPYADPKAIISELEDAGAVWLEKRRGNPYDYTVLLVDDRHPAVLEVRERFLESATDEPYEVELAAEDAVVEDEVSGPGLSTTERGDDIYDLPDQDD